MTPIALPESTDSKPAKAAHKLECRCPHCNRARKAATPPTPTEDAPKLDTVARAKRAAAARWDTEAELIEAWEKMPLEEAKLLLATMRSELEQAARILQQRLSDQQQANISCATCEHTIPEGRWAQQRTVRDPDTGLLRTIFLCSQRCIALLNQGRIAKGLPLEKSSIV